MADIKPNSTYTINGITIKEKIIPDGTVWINSEKAIRAGFKAGERYKKETKLTSNTGKVQCVTIHTTNAVSSDEDAKQYTAATYNENMGSARVHFYVDNIGAWQNMRAGTGKCANDPEGSAEVSWHAGDGSVPTGGNMTSISIEIIMGATEEKDKAAMDNAARLSAWLLSKHNLSIEQLVTHTYWVNKSAGKVFENVDEQCTNIIYGQKWCPYYIFKSNDRNVALINWKDFKSMVERYNNDIASSKVKVTDTVSNGTNNIIEIGDLVKISNDATYYSGTAIPSWVKNQNWYVKSIDNNRIVINENQGLTHAICSPIHKKYLTIVKKDQSTSTQKPFTPYLVKITVDDLKIRSGAGTNHPHTDSIIGGGIFTIVAEADGKGATKWGKLKSGAGWISLDYTIRV